MIISKTYYFYITRKHAMQIAREFWNGHTWTTVLFFAQMYTGAQASKILLKRFQHADPKPEIRLIRDFRKPKK